MSIVRHEDLEPAAETITQGALKDAKSAKEMGWDHIWGRAIEQWQMPTLLYEGTGECLLCGKAVSVPFIYWACAHSFCLHPACLDSLGPGLMRDLIELKEGKQAAWAWLADWDKSHQ
jgi:hypothetical protein